MERLARDCVLDPLVGESSTATHGMQLKTPDHNTIYRSRCNSARLDWQGVPSDSRHWGGLIVLRFRLLVSHGILLLVQIGIVVEWWLRWILFEWFAQFWKGEGVNFECCTTNVSHWIRSAASTFFALCSSMQKFMNIENIKLEILSRPPENWYESQNEIFCFPLFALTKACSTFKKFFTA